MTASRLEEQLRGKFSENPWKFTHKGILVGAEIDVPFAERPKMVYPFFPERCLSADCAFWAANAALSFADDFFYKIGINPVYQDVKPVLKNNR
jgi:hypothetical protein